MSPQEYIDISKFLKIREKSYPWVMGKHPLEKKKMRHPCDPIEIGDIVTARDASDALVEVKIEKTSGEICGGRVINVHGKETKEIFIGATVSLSKNRIDTIFGKG